MLHHSRFADVDRQYLDREVLRLIGLRGHRSGIVIVGTQTLEQSIRATWLSKLSQVRPRGLLALTRTVEHCSALAVCLSRTGSRGSIEWRASNPSRVGFSEVSYLGNLRSVAAITLSQFA